MISKLDGENYKLNVEIDLLKRLITDKDKEI